VAERTESQTGDVATENDAESQESVNDEPTAAAAESADGEGELFSASERDELEEKWNDIQARFVDEPRGSVEEANALVSDLMDRLVSSFSEQRDRLEEQWDRGDDVSTEDLRIVLMRYRSFFGRLLEVPVDR
jgi:polyhydroxyalkanoate synthesis regulator phasin